MDMAATSPDFEADWLHREAMFVLNRWASDDFGTDYESLDVEKSANWRDAWQSSCEPTRTTRIPAIRSRPTKSRSIPIKPGAVALGHLNGKTDYAESPAGTVTEEIHSGRLAFFFWSASASTTEPQDDHISYTNNWPYDPLVGNRRQARPLCGPA